MDIIGAGWAFPAVITGSGRVGLATGADDVEQAVRIILATAPGERPMRPEFGCGIHRLVFDSLDATTVARADVEVRRALDRWEPRIELDDLLFSTDTVDTGVLYIDLRYRLRATNEPRNLVFPFYTLPGAPATATASGAAPGA
ncbi:GPW/gp25 family protein [Streptomyces sp. NBC_00536]|uniref:GPW/gp25 family protein n=1 Tax=Streptomyces sp. NBC_00536 TaxID=2975769 RepID=UPI002E802887|nr:GPW/gp25 family protein [Streptomyces sp. NBC_00536]WUC82450.1 GPW/gp25 family protein [Streptomyces sp. NBC_00536]